MKRKDVITLIVTVIILSMISYVTFFKESERTAPIKEAAPEPVVAPTPAAEEKPTNPHLSKYAGGYTVRVLTKETPGVAEVYILNENGNAKWMWLEDDGTGGVKKVSEKTGTWTAEKNKISISIQGNSGLLKEEFTWWRPPGGKRGYFINKQTQRFIERTN
jgi:hypothetical protein